MINHCLILLLKVTWKIYYDGKYLYSAFFVFVLILSLYFWRHSCSDHQALMYKTDKHVYWLRMRLVSCLCNDFGISVQLCIQGITGWLRPTVLTSFLQQQEVIALQCWELREGSPKWKRQFTNGLCKRPNLSCQYQKQSIKRELRAHNGYPGLDSRNSLFHSLSDVHFYSALDLRKNSITNRNTHSDFRFRPYIWIKTRQS